MNHSQLIQPVRAMPRVYRSISLLAAVGLAAVIGMACSSCSRGKAQTLEGGANPETSVPKPGTPNAQIAVAPVEQHEVGKSIVSSARIAFDDQKVGHVFSPVTGRVISISAQLGQHVKKGQTLATIVSPDLGVAMSDVEKAKADLVAAEHEEKRQKELYAAHAGAQRDLESAEDNARKAAAELSRAQEKMKLLIANGAKSSVSQQFLLTAPIDGEIVARNINPGIEVQGQYNGGASQELFTVGKLDTVWVLADVYEQDIGRVKLGAPVHIKVVAYPDRVFEGKVDWISGTLDPATRTAKVRVILNNEERLLKPEMYATAEIEAEGRKAVAIPRTSLLHLGDKTVVIAVDDVHGKYERRPVIVDEDESGDWIPVLHGLDAGEKVVTSGALLLSETVN